MTRATTPSRTSSCHVRGAKSGSNSLHGVGFAYFRNSSLIAKDFVTKTNLPYSDQQYGGTLGGPILKNKLWFFGSYEGERTPETYVMAPIDFGGETFTQGSTVTIKQMLERVDYQASDSSRYFFRVTGYTQGDPYAGLSGSSLPSSTEPTWTTWVITVLVWSPQKTRRCAARSSSSR